MLDRLWHYCGFVALDPALPLDRVIARLVDRLSAGGQTVTDHAETALRFTYPFLASSRTDPFVMFESGQVWTERSRERVRLHYDLRSLHTLITCAVAAGFAWYIGCSDQDWRPGPIFAGGAFAWLYGMNCALARWRVPGVLKRWLESEAGGVRMRRHTRRSRLQLRPSKLALRSSVNACA